jgi:predicted deacetylase
LRKQTISLDLHDFSVLRNRFDLLLKLKEHYPQAKVSLFTIPYDYEVEMTTQAVYRDKALSILKENLDWLQIIPHGLSHIPREFEKADAQTMELTLEAIDQMFTKDGIPYEKGFCAPYWLWTQDVVDVLDKHGWWGAVDRNQPNMLKTKRFYTYSHSIDEDFSKATGDLKLHGHMGKPSSNGLGDCFTNLFKIDESATWHFVSDMLEES